MKYFAGLDVSLQETAICIVDEDGIVISEGKTASEPGDLARWIATTGLTITRVGVGGRTAVALAVYRIARGGFAGDLHRNPSDEGRYRRHGCEDRSQ